MNFSVKFLKKIFPEISFFIRLVMIFKFIFIIYRPIQASTRTHRRHVVHEEGDLTTYRSTIEDHERPPSYNEAVHNASFINTYSDNAPPLYASPYNRVYKLTFLVY